jgi:hypothetical protein
VIVMIARAVVLLVVVAMTVPQVVIVMIVRVRLVHAVQHRVQVPLIVVTIVLRVAMTVHRVVIVAMNAAARMGSEVTIATRQVAQATTAGTIVASASKSIVAMKAMKSAIHESLTTSLQMTSIRECC